MSEAKLPAPGPERREQVLELLSQYFTVGKIELEDMERRMEIAARAETTAELESALEGLRENLVAAVPVAKPMGPDHPKARRISIAIMSGTDRKGRWFPARRHVGIALMGGMDLDFRDAELLPGVTEVELWVMWGGIDVIVPPDLDVEVDGFALMGGIGELDQHPGPLEQQRHKLRIKARVLMGGVDVKVKPRKDSEAAELPHRPKKRLP